MELAEYRGRWQQKPVLRGIYEDYYRTIASACVPGPVLEVGGGSGNLKSVINDVVSIDIQAAAWLDVVADAQRLPFVDRAFQNIVMVDVLHHIQFPVHFFREAARVLKPGGRIVALEPAITPLSWLFYKTLHDEPVDMKQDPYVEGTPDPEKDPFDANQAIPTLLFCKDPATFKRKFPEFRIVGTRFKSLFAYPLSGGFKSWSLIPNKAVPSVLSIEERLLPVIGKWMAFRLLVVIEKVR